MPAPLRHGPPPRGWHNYHDTHSCRPSDRIELVEPNAATGREIIRTAARDAQALLALARGRTPVRPIGASWSLSALNMVPDGGWIIETARLNRTFRVRSDWVRPGSGLTAELLLLAQAGASVDELSDSAQELGRSLRSNGASNGQTIAGAIATGTHGSVLDCGGIQDHIRAIQIVTPASNFWIEPAAGLFTDTVIGEFGATPLRGDDLFQAAVVHLGALGFVNAVVLETVPIYLVEVVQTKKQLGRADIQRLADGDYQGFSDSVRPRGAPYFIQVILNPYQPFGENALIRMLYKRPFAPGQRPGPERTAAGHDVMTLAGALLGQLGPNNGQLLQLLMNAQYPEVPGSGPPVLGTWGETVTAHVPMANLFSASFAVPRDRAADALDALVPAYVAAQGETLVTLRFVEKSAGLLAFTQYDHNCVIDFDGARTEPSLQALRSVFAALGAAQLPFRRHWGKIHELDAARVAQDYAATLPRWRAARDRILPAAADRALFRNAEHVRLGL